MTVEKLYLRYLADKVMYITLTINENGKLDGMFSLTEIVTVATPFITYVPNISSTSHPFVGKLEGNQLNFTFTGKALSLNPDWKDPFDGVVWVGESLQSKLIINVGEYNGEYSEGTLEEYTTMLDELYTTLNIK
ncbi:hypothetical protein BC351_12265 [Paenibacillus ferrarius]|uniref:Uncharacterized protein n=1 Tax=Paenibacillus ferrarius TaxID=1469647 RepID=A0A1V4H8C9_9BACL|nr:hypothetical protein [Paenibacillus ferrarius]OPH47267.1 hypothetical protein BC351_12265 [Paenibacillus ferrarius]